jgi:FtsP/CotA-like multicopper oxidase with cupredoxin domain
MGMQMTKAQAIEHCTMMPEMKGCEPYLSGRQTVNDGIEWEDNMAAMNSMMNVQNTKWKIIDEQTGKENMDISWELKNGVKQTNLVWKDTALVKIGETVKIVLLPDNPGKWMAHCHISEHLASGMMFGFEVK